jgi:tripeptidyl-peptidase-1
VGSNVSVYSVNGGMNNQSTPGIEAMLDVEYAFGIAYPAKATFYTTAGSPPFHTDNQTTVNSNEPYQDWLDFVFNQTQAELPRVISTSYGDDEQTVPRSYALRVCAGFAQLGARGVSGKQQSSLARKDGLRSCAVVFSSGDGGVGDGATSMTYTRCYANDGSGRREFLPTFPATCPYVTSVGSTRYIKPETAADFSGGGFSNYFSRPLYQALAVPGFLSHLPNTTYAGLYNATGRGVPDISAQGAKFEIRSYGEWTTASGTSASAPSVAGLLAKLNALRLQAGMPSIGFVNPLLYGGAATARGFHDITTGSNPGCGTPGFNATSVSTSSIPKRIFHADTWGRRDGTRSPGLERRTSLS